MEKNLQPNILVISWIKILLKDTVALHQKERFWQNVSIERLEIFLKKQCLIEKTKIGWMTDMQYQNTKKLKVIHPLNWHQ